MPSSLRLGLRLIGVGIGGYLVIALLQTLVLEVGLRGQLTVESSILILSVATIGTVMSGLIGGYLTAWAGGSRPMMHVAAVLVPLAVDTIFVTSRSAGGGVLWFEFAGAATLFLATIGGGLIRARGVGQPR